MGNNHYENRANDSEKRKHARILNSSKYLSAFVDEKEAFYVGLLYEDYINSPYLDKYGLPKDFVENASFTPKAKKAASKNNVNGKFVRKQPEEKVTNTKHIEYTTKDGTHVSYNRDFHIYAKALLHKYNIQFTFKTNIHGIKIVVSSIPLVYINDIENNMKNTHVINLFCEIFNDFEVFTSKLEPAIHFNKRFDMELLPKGTLNEAENFEEVVRISSHYVKDNKEQKAFQKRLHLLKDYEPDIRGKGPNNFFGYIVFGFSNLDIILLETMYSNNATYVFKLSDYETNIIRDKQSVLREKLMIERFYHDANWEKRIRRFLNNRIKSCEGNIPHE
ncbi:hypothetical protein [Prevotella sp.]|uniref:hypothetical protein n=1 Tax=Prevotella sp. TaxID=59823 RepID=UPI002647D6AC|nr:hypothetical protein [Prevotella sp.]MDN5554257.1 hypothetical protein [Prevotella sp.]